MEEKELTIQVSNDRIYINPRLSIPIQNTNIPKDHLKFRSRADIFWQVEILSYNSDGKCLNVSVKDYNSTDVSNFDTQQPSEGIEKMIFDKFDWKKLQLLLISYQISKFREDLFNIDDNPFRNGNPSLPTSYKYNSIFSSSLQLKEANIKPIITKITEDFWMHFTDAQFMSGYVTFKKHIKKLKSEVEFKIANAHILAEFNNIKFWFIKKLKTKKFGVNVVITLTDDEVTETFANSTQIDQITPELIEAVKYQRTFALTKEPRVTNTNKTLFTAEEIFSQIDTGDIEGNVFKQSEEDVLNFLVNKKTVRNKKQLEFLSAEMQSESNKLRYTLNPNFGFLFFVEGIENNHFIWELLNSHATYIWSIRKQHQENEQQFISIESIISTIRKSGRENYKRAYKNNYQDNGLVFKVINHEDIGSNLKGFEKWKIALNEQLT